MIALSIKKPAIPSGAPTTLTVNIVDAIAVPKNPKITTYDKNIESVFGILYFDNLTINGFIIETRSSAIKSCRTISRIKYKNQSEAKKTVVNIIVL